MHLMFSAGTTPLPLFLTKRVKRVEEGFRGWVDAVADVVVEDLPALLQA